VEIESISERSSSGASEGSDEEFSIKKYEYIENDRSKNRKKT
jgi:hypothetical protein